MSGGGGGTILQRTIPCLLAQCCTGGKSDMKSPLQWPPLVLSLLPLEGPHPVAFQMARAGMVGKEAAGKEQEAALKMARNGAVAFQKKEVLHFSGA